MIYYQIHHQSSNGCHYYLIPKFSTLQTKILNQKKFQLGIKSVVVETTLQNLNADERIQPPLVFVEIDLLKKLRHTVPN